MRLFKELTDISSIFKPYRIEQCASLQFYRRSDVASGAPRLENAARLPPARIHNHTKPLANKRSIT